MSLILDALKKLDREKSFRRRGAANIASEILNVDFPRRGKRMGIYLAGVSFTVVAAAAVTYAVITEFGFLSKAPPPVPLAPAPRQEVASVPSPQAAPAPPEPVRDDRDRMSPISKIQIPAEGKIPTESKNPVPSPSEERTTRNVMLKEAPIAPKTPRKTVEQTPQRPAATAPSLNLEGIIWSEEPSKRFALINNAIAAEGSEIRGVKVIKIDPHLVHFSYNGQPFEISLYQ